MGVALELLGVVEQLKELGEVHIGVGGQETPADLMGGELGEAEEVFREEEGLVPSVFDTLGYALLGLLFDHI
jgi:hypothetical protein